MELSIAPRELTPSVALADDVVPRYLAAMPIGDAAQHRLRAHVRDRVDARGVTAEDPGSALHLLHEALAERELVDPDLACASARRRLELAFGERAIAEVVGVDLKGRERLLSTPPLQRTPMAPHRWSFLARLRRPKGEQREASTSNLVHHAEKQPWQRAASIRRFGLGGIVLAQTWLATTFLASVLPYQGRPPLELALLALFAVLFAWISAGFWTAIAGFVLLWAGGDRFAISRTLPEAAMAAPLPDDVRIAIVMPIANEDVRRVFAGVRAMYESLARTADAAHFDFFVLSDSSDADTRVGERQAWLELCRDVGGFGRIFYRWRKHRIKRKSGNVADFCRRWGSRYRYMVVLDADSVMTGSCLVRLARLAEANPTAGIIQTAPYATGRQTLLARVHQFATRVYGPLFTAGLHFWQLGESHYWGHNAIIRVAPFMRHCALQRLPGRGSLSGEILSHDFVEAALMRRAGWAVWIAYDLPGSYEEVPPNLVDELGRDQRWCRGNLMNFRLFLMRGVHPAHRAVFVSGVMAYLSSPLWLVFLALSTALVAVHTLVVPQYFTEPYQLFPLWPQWRPEWALRLSAATAALLFLPKMLGAALIDRGNVAHHGGRVRLLLSTAAEIVLSVLLAPIRMLFHTQFVVRALSGDALRWKSPPRDDSETRWREAFRYHALQTLIGIAWIGGVYALDPAYVPWLLPVAGAFMLAIPLSALTSRASLGRRFARAGLFLIPEETAPPAEICAVGKILAQARAPATFRDAIVDPIANAAACLAAVHRPRLPSATRVERRALADAALTLGPDALTPAQKAALLDDPAALARLHFAVWTAPAEIAAKWRRSELDARRDRLAAA
jgi:membrane glycosyltransferase